MSPLAESLLKVILPLLEELVAAEGPAVINWLRGQLIKLEQKYSAPAPVNPPASK